MKNLNELLSKTKKYHHRKRVLRFFVKAYQKLNFCQKLKRNFFKRYFDKKTHYLSSKDNLKELVCYQQKNDFFPMYVDLPLIA